MPTQIFVACRKCRNLAHTAWAEKGFTSVGTDTTKHLTSGPRSLRQDKVYLHLKAPFERTAPAAKWLSAVRQLMAAKWLCMLSTCSRMWTCFNTHMDTHTHSQPSPNPPTHSSTHTDTHTHT